MSTTALIQQHVDEASSYYFMPQEKIAMFIISYLQSKMTTYFE